MAVTFDIFPHVECQDVEDLCVASKKLLSTLPKTLKLWAFIEPWKQLMFAILTGLSKLGTKGHREENVPSAAGDLGA